MKVDVVVYEFSGLIDGVGGFRHTECAEGAAYRWECENSGLAPKPDEDDMRKYIAHHFVDVEIRDV